MGRSSQAGLKSAIWATARVLNEELRVAPAGAPAPCRVIPATMAEAVALRKSCYRLLNNWRADAVAQADPTLAEIADSLSFSLVPEGLRIGVRPVAKVIERMALLVDGAGDGPTPQCHLPGQNAPATPRGTGGIGDSSLTSKNAVTGLLSIAPPLVTTADSAAAASEARLLKLLEANAPADDAPPRVTKYYTRDKPED